MNEKKEFAGWWLWILVLVVITTIIFSFLTFGSTIMERMVFENSYQKQAGDQKQLNTWRAQLAAINSKLVNPKVK